MTNTLKTRLLLTLALPLLTGTVAQAQIGSWLSDWTGETAISGSATTGNTETLDVGVSLDLGKEVGPWTHTFDANYDYGEAEDIENKNRFHLGYQLDRQITDRLYAYGNANYFDDDFGAFESGYFLGTGLGYDVFINEPKLWSVEGGIGFRNQTAQGSDDDENEFALRAASDFDYAFNDAVSLFNDSEVIWSDSDTYLWNDVGINAKLSDKLAARVSFRVDYHTDAPVGREDTDTTTRVALAYTID